MYDTPDAPSLKKQLGNQQKHIDYLKDNLKVTNAIQIALLPRSLSDKVNDTKNGVKYIANSNYQIITWEQLYDSYQEMYKDDYFLGTLKLALDSYDALVSTSWGVIKNREQYLKGKEIYKGFKSGTLTMKIMGRKNGLDGEPLKKDIETGKWKTQQYETNSKTQLPSDNWFQIGQFVQRIDEHSSKGK